MGSATGVYALENAPNLNVAIFPISVGASVQRSKTLFCIYQCRLRSLHIMDYQVLERQDCDT